MIAFCCIAMTATAQEFPPFNNATWAGDTIIYRGPALDSNKHGSKAPSRLPSVTVVYNQEYLCVSIYPETPFGYVLSNDEGIVSFNRETTNYPSTPYIIDLTTLPTGHYTLLLYINNECLEGEFEKED